VSKTNRPNKEIRTTILIPADLADWVNKRKSESQHNRNLSSYVRWLIICDKADADKKEAA
jgi:hypothetical protein